jgi:hypothetical protein
MTTSNPDASPAMTLAELTGQLVEAGWPRGYVRNNGHLDLSTRPPGRGLWVLGETGLDGVPVITLHLPEEWAVLDAAVSIRLGKDGQLGDALL